MKTIWMTGRSLTWMALWWLAIVAGVGAGYIVLCNLSGRASLHDLGTMLELACCALQVAIGGVAGQFLWGVEQAERLPKHLHDCVPQSVRDDVRAARAWGYVVAAITGVMGVVSFLAYDSSLLPVRGHTLLFVGVSTAVLAYGVGRNSRTCAVLLFAAYVLGLPMKMAYYRGSDTLFTVAGLALVQSAIVLWAYGRGVRGTWAFHRWMKLPRYTTTRPQAHASHAGYDGFEPSRLMDVDYGFRWGRPSR